ncbi:hypothetical protein [Bacillus nitratireducens]|uniref:hypothetical protein n=1 Tax=Bacillus nitratireducens TaxID=2026193 RepID=UPI000A27CAA1|nr:hypothetical protein [Bacillus nitratireducens]OSX98789.1 hypothetical protein BTJ45_04805 [Bacillus mycoides]PDY08452.1 hypothetical protein COM83_32085 [Bacillus cereus]PFJ45213.1 hypothetical protein COI99_28455 [Bacillus cereus]PFW08790.1 hypothetical protein COL18_26625 [Bacillus cereus]PGW92605.1 hypothetical protein COE40_30060 [Bacillus cereus]
MTLATIEDLRGKTIEEAMQLGADITSPAQKEARKNKPKKYYEGNDQFVMVKKDIEQAQEFLSLEQSGIMMFLLGFAKLGENGTLYVEQGDSKKAERLTVSKLADLLGKKQRMTINILDELERLSLIVRTKEGRNTVISLGENFFHIGKGHKESNFTKVYKTKLIEVAKKITFSELGLFFKLLNHFHFELHILVDNPHEVNKSELDIWSRKHIAPSVGCSEDFTKKAIPKLIRAGLLMEINSVKKVIILNPQLVSKKLRTPNIRELASFSKDNFKK